MVRKKNYDQHQMKAMILEYLYNKKDGANAHDIQFYGIPGRTTEGSRFKMLLEELCLLGQLDEIDVSHVRKGGVIYRITVKGRLTVDDLRKPHMKEFLDIPEKEI